MSISFQAA